MMMMMMMKKMRIRIRMHILSEMLALKRIEGCPNIEPHIGPTTSSTGFSSINPTSNASQYQLSNTQTIRQPSCSSYISSPPNISKYSCESLHWYVLYVYLYIYTYAYVNTLYILIYWYIYIYIYMLIIYIYIYRHIYTYCYNMSKYLFVPKCILYLLYSSQYIFHSFRNSLFCPLAEERKLNDRRLNGLT